MRFIIDAPISTEPRAWKVSKVNRLSYNGLALVTCAQDKYDQNHDYIERDEDGNVIGMWADYYADGIEPEPIWKPIISSHIYSKITYNGSKPEIKVGGTPKKLTLTFYDENEIIEHSMGDWSFYIDDTDISNFIQLDILSDNQISVGIKDIDAEYIGKVVRITNTTTDNIVSYVDLEIADL